HAYALDEFSAGRWSAPNLTKANYQGRDHHNADPIGQEPHTPCNPKWRSGMELGHCRRTTDGRNCGSEGRRGYKTQHATQIIKGEWTTEPTIDQPGHQRNLGSIAKAFKYRGPKGPVAHEVGGNSGEYHANQNRWTETPI